MKSIEKITFLIILFAIAINHLFGIVDKEDKNENRKLAEHPSIDITYLDKYPGEYDKYLNDNFAGRSYFINAYKWISTNIFKKKNLNKKFLLGKDNYIFEMKNDLQLFTGKKSLSQEQLERIKIEFVQREKYFNSIGAEMYIITCPSKYSVYDNKLPSLLLKSKNHMGDKFIEYLNNNSALKVINGTNILKPLRNEENLYLKYDTHWNTLGSYFACNALINAIKKDFNNISKLDTNYNISISKYNKTDGNLKNVAPDPNDNDFGYKITPKEKTFKRNDGYTHIKHTDFPYSQWEYQARYISKNKTLPKTIIFRDSYANFTKSFLPESFSETLYIWDNWQYLFNKDIVDVEKPNIIIYMIYEGFIDRILMDPSFVKADTKESELQ